MCECCRPLWWHATLFHLNNKQQTVGSAYVVYVTRVIRAQWHVKLNHNEVLTVGSLYFFPYFLLLSVYFASSLTHTRLFSQFAMFKRSLREYLLLNECRRYFKLHLINIIKMIPRSFAHAKRRFFITKGITTTTRTIHRLDLPRYCCGGAMDA